MEEPAPKGIVVVDREHDKTTKQIASDAGVPTTNVSPDPIHILKKIEAMVGDGAEVIGSETPDFDTFFQGERPLANVGTSAGEKLSQVQREREEKLRAFQNKKAA